MPLLVAVSLSPADVRAADYEFLAATGEQAPGTAPGVVFADFSTEILLDAAGQILFEGTLSGPGVTAGNDRGLWHGGAGSLSLVAREGSPAIGIDGALHETGFDPSLVANGAWGFAGSVSTAGGFASWLDHGAGLELLRRPGQLAEGTPNGVMFDSLGLPRHGAAGTAVMVASLTGPGVDTSNDRGLWKSTPTAFQLLAREGAPAQGVAPASTIESFRAPVIGPDGTIAFVANLVGGGSALYVDSGSGPVLRHQHGDIAPGGTDAYTEFFNASVDAAGRIAFGARLDNLAEDRAIFAERATGLELVARPGQPAPGVDDATFADVGSLQMGASGALIFAATLQGAGVTPASDRALYRDLGSGPELLVREGQFVGTVSGGGSNLILVHFGDYFEMAISDGGRVLARSIVDGTDTNQSWLFWFGRDGVRHRLLRQGDGLALAPGDVRTVGSFQVAGLSPPRAPGLGTGVAERAVMARVRFADDSRAVVRIPEPAPGPAVALAALAALATWRRIGARSSTKTPRRSEPRWALTRQS